MSLPKTYRAWRRSVTPYPLSLVLSTEQLPEKLGPNDVLIRIHAASLNYRDHAMLKEGKYPVDVEIGGVVGSDCAAQVVAVGENAARFSVGDHVAPTVDLLSLTGHERQFESVALGGNGPGTLQEYAVFDENVLVKLPSRLSWEEASTLPGVGTTVWNVFDGFRKPTADTAALLQGTGGVSIMALLVCLAAGIKPIITSSSDDKLARLQKLSPNVTGINYRTADVKDEVLKMTDGKGVDFILNNVGISSLPEDLDLVRKNGSIALVGFLDGFTAKFPPEILHTLLYKAGSRADFEALNAFLEEKKVDLAPIVDKVFSFDEVPRAMEYLASGRHVGKVVVKFS
ncbi:chaperonin 10-like protein [Paraphoma chrysanthemicola]|nr:chaperonin 10-like protein [Paraphoma chrysanthemicola]